MLPKTTSAKNWSIAWSFVFWHLRYVVNELAHSTVAGLLIAITLIFSFLLHDSDIARIFHADRHSALELPTCRQRRA